MAIIAQQTLFVWDEIENIENIGDIERLKLVIEYMPDEERMKASEESRGNGRNDYPIWAMWNSFLAGVVYQHTGVEKRKKLKMIER